MTSSNFNILLDSNVDSEMRESGSVPITSSVPTNGQCLQFNSATNQYVYATPVSATTGTNTFTGNNTFTGSVQIGAGSTFISQWIWGTTASIGPVLGNSSVDAPITYAAFTAVPRIIATAQSTNVGDSALAVVVHNKTTTGAVIRVTNYSGVATTGTITIDWTAEG